MNERIDKKINQLLLSLLILLINNIIGKARFPSNYGGLYITTYRPREYCLTMSYYSNTEEQKHSGGLHIKY